MVARGKPNSRTSRGGAIAKRRSALRADKDGDVSMDTSTRARGGISKSKPPTGPASDVSLRKPRAGLTAGRLKAEITRHVSSGAVTVKSRGSTGTPSRAPVELRITGWADSKASSGADSGVSTLITWLEKKATMRSSSKRPVKIRKVCQQTSTTSSFCHHVNAGPLSFAAKPRTTTGIQRLGIPPLG